MVSVDFLSEQPGNTEALDILQAADFSVEERYRRRGCLRCRNCD